MFYLLRLRTNQSENQALISATNKGTKKLENIVYTFNPSQIGLGDKKTT